MPRHTGQWERDMLSKIVYHINNDTPAGLRLKSSFEIETGEQISYVKERGGRKYHHDLLIKTISGREFRTEVKGSCRFTPIDPTIQPWITGIQFSNGNPKSYDICKLYGRVWFEFIKDLIYENNIRMENETPSEDEYLKTIFKQSKNLNPWVLEAREKLGGLDYRVQFKTVFDNLITPEALEQLRFNINIIFQKCMREKDIWLQFHGDIDDNFDALWTLGRTYSDVHTVEIIQHRKDYKFRCITDDLTFEAHMRWGYYQGIGNLRLDLK